MTVLEIIKAVRWCVDEESNLLGDLSDDVLSALTSGIDNKGDLYMNNIIRDKIAAATNWIAVTAPSQSLGYSSDADGVFIKNYTATKKKNDTDESDAMTDEDDSVLEYNADWDATNGIGCITFPSDNPVRLLRLRGKDWHKAISVPYEEDADESLYMYDETAKGTIDRPIAVIVRSSPTQLLVQPASDEFSLTFVKTISVENDSSDIPIPESLKSAFIYYLAFLLLSAFDDSKANQMYTIALQQLGATTSSK